MTHQGVHFIAHRRGVSGTELFTCRETGDRYAIRPTLSAYQLRHAGELIAERRSRSECVNFMGQDAQLRFITAQSDCGAWASLEA